MKILKISDVYFPRINGVSTSISTFRKELEALGHEVTLVAPAYPPSHGSVPANGVVRVTSRRVPFDPEDRLMARSSLEDEISRLSRDADLIHVHTPFLAHRVGVKVAAQRGIPVVETYHTFFEEYLYHYVPLVPRALLGSLARRFSRAQCDELDHVIVPSTAMAEALAAYGVTAPMKILPTGIDLEALSHGDGDRFRRHHGIPRSRPTLVHVGRMAHEKNVAFLLRTLAVIRERRPEVLLVLAGEGPALGKLHSEAHRLGLDGSVLFVGYLDRDGALQACYSAGDVFVFASRTETQGLVLLEAMALGVPVVSTAVMGTRDIVGPERGALRAPDDEAGFAAQVLRLLGDADLRRTKAAEAREEAQRWSSGAMAGRLVELYEEVLEGAPTSVAPVTGADSREL